MKITVDLQDFDGIETLSEVLKMYAERVKANGNTETTVDEVQFQTNNVQVQQESQGVVPLQQIPPLQQEVIQQPTQHAHIQTVEAPPVQQTPAQTEMPTTVQSYSMDQLAVAATQLIDAGRIAEIQQLLAQFGVQALTALPKEQYGAFATALRGMGAKI